MSEEFKNFLIAVAAVTVSAVVLVNLVDALRAKGKIN